MDPGIPVDTFTKIINDGGFKTWAKSFPPSGSRPPFYLGITFDDNFGSIYQAWEIHRFEEGYTIQSMGNGFKAYRKDGEVVTSNEFDAAHCKWYIESAGNNTYKIKVPNRDLVWTVKRRNPQFPLSVLLAPADGNENQNFSFGPMSSVAETED